MVSTKKLITMAKRWHKFAAKQRKRISFPRMEVKQTAAVHPHPLELKRVILWYIQLIKHEEFGLPSGGPITLPSDSGFMNYIISLIKKGVAAGDLQRALLLSIPSCCSSTFSLHQKSRNQQILVY
ncbi:hypothetical protein MTR67_046500 [Solanum verrucosum]|uniref:Uncharacterized protein n=2 Tax=Solanum verrucosum TaxID=315347 RepID=A0AAF0UW17_SOLVR|nr:hypothetical protein MTR67_046500 [Solanum verrucosum]